ncbi:MAG: hypothetical protein EBR09_02395 [Proteobacteria bacterium]|nr:hypothetical protein [Pseudomonadota bacterium]
MSNVLMRISLPLFLALAATVGCKPRTFNTMTQAAGAGQERWLQEWSNETQKNWWYLTPQGSLVVPMDIFRSLETEEGGTLFSDRQNMRQFGWVYPPRSEEGKYNLFGLPLGFVQEPDAKNDNRMTMGFTCAACHTGELQVGNTRAVVDGGQPLVNLDKYNVAFLKALQAVKKNPQRLTAMRTRISQFNPKSPYVQKQDLLKRDFEERLEYFTERMTRNTPKVTGGHGRLDAVTQILNEILVDHAQLNEKDQNGHYLNARFPAAPISFPTLWKVPDFECVQTNCLARNPLTRNLGEVLGVYGRIQLRLIDNKDKGFNWNDVATLAAPHKLFDISANLHNLHRLEESLKFMPAPKWSEDLLGGLDAELVQKGEEVYSRKQFSDGKGNSFACVSCHVKADKNNPESLTNPNRYGKRFLRVTRHSPDYVKTDTAFLEEHGARTAASSLPIHLSSIYDVLVNKNEPFFDRFDPNEKKSALKFLGLINLLAVKKWFAVNKFNDDRKAEYSSYQEPSTDFNAGVYKARPLVGIAFSAPYLHNGSIPTLAEFFKKPEDRVRSFSTGTLQYDSKSVGYSFSAESKYVYGQETFNTSIRGNKNTGHTWGTELSSEDKDALIEYLKTL